jgi:hypothetical protein
MRKLYLLIVLLSSQIAGQTASGQTVQQPVISQFGVQTAVMVPDRGGVFLGGVKRAGESSFNSIFSPIGSSVGRFSEHTGLSAHVFISDLREMDELILEAADRPDGLDYLRRIHSGVAFDNSISYRGGAISEVSPLAGRYPYRASRVSIPYRPGYTGSSSLSPRTTSHYGATVLPTNRLSHNLTARSSSAKQAQSDQFLADLERSMRPSVPQAVRIATVAAKPRKPSPPPQTQPTKLDASRSYLLARKAERAGQTNLAILHYRTAAQLGSKVAEKRLRDLNDVTVAKK